jgi:phosphate-selective porin OprO/OprP
MKKLMIAGLMAGTFLAPAQAAAQDTETEDLRAQIAAMEAMVEKMSAKLERLEAVQAEQVESAAVPAEAPPAAEEGVSIDWKGAPEISGPGGWSFKPRGRIMVDGGIVDAPDGLDVEDGFGSELRRARLGVEGDIPGGFGYKFEVDFAGNEVDVTDAVLTYGDGGFELTVGQHNNFQSLEELTSSRFSSFIERAAFTDAFGFERRLGVSAEYGAGDVLVQAGVFSDNIDDLPGQNWSADGRVVYMPKLGDTQLHLGASLHLTDLDEESTVRYRQRPLVHFTSERFINTDDFSAESETGAGLEAAAIAGPLHFAGEAFWQSADRPGDLPSADFFGGYAEVGYFLTEGDRRGYKGGKFDRVKPANPVGEGGLGALQVNLRYDYLDLTDGPITGGTQDGYMASLIWTPTDHTRLLLNYARLSYDGAVYALPDGDDSYSVDTVGVRAQVDF